MKLKLTRATGACAILLAALALGDAARGQTIIEEWSNVKPPAPPELKPVTIDPKTTALLLLDFARQTCSPRPRCLASLPQGQKLATAARGKDMLVVHSLFGQATPADLLKEVAPQGDEPLVRSGANKFLRTDLGKILKDKGITTVIVTGTAAHGAVLNTAAAAAHRLASRKCSRRHRSAGDAHQDRHDHLLNGPQTASIL